MSTTLHHTPKTGRNYRGTGADDRYQLGINRLGMLLGTLLAVTFTLAVAFDLAFPNLATNPAWIWTLPGVTWISIPSFLLGLIEAFAYGWFASVILVPVYNFFVRNVL